MYNTIGQQAIVVAKRNLHCHFINQYTAVNYLYCLLNDYKYLLLLFSLCSVSIFITIKVKINEIKILAGRA